jgi:hypothetical protein
VPGGAIVTRKNLTYPFLADTHFLPDFTHRRAGTAHLEYDVFVRNCLRLDLCNHVVAPPRSAVLTLYFLLASCPFGNNRLPYLSFHIKNGR